MKPYPTIADSIESLSQGEIERNNRKRISSIICMILGIPLIWWGIVKWTVIGYEYISYILVFGGLFLIGWGVVMLTSKNCYVCKETGERVRSQKIFLDPDQKDALLECMENEQLGDVLKHAVKRNSPLMLEIWQVNGHKLLYSQLLYYHDSKTRPISPVHKTDKEQMTI